MTRTPDSLKRGGKCKQSANMPHAIHDMGKSSQSRILSNRAKRLDSPTPHDTPEMAHNPKVTGSNPAPAMTVVCAYFARSSRARAPGRARLKVWRGSVPVQALADPLQGDSRAEALRALVSSGTSLGHRFPTQAPSLGMDSAVRAALASAASGADCRARFLAWCA